MRTPRLVIASALASILLPSVFAQSPATDRTWSQTYGGPVSAQGLHKLRELPGGRLVVAGSTGSFGGPGQFGWLMQISLPDGDVQVEQACSSSVGGFTDGAGIAADGGALFLGRHVIDIFTKHDAWLVRTDATGNVLWTQAFTRPGTGKHFLFDAAELADGSWVAVGATSLFDFPPQAAWVVRLSANGKVLWHSEYSGGQLETARSVAPTADGGFAVAGWSSSSGAGQDDAWVMKLDAAGEIEWQRTYGGFDVDQAEEIVELDDGSFAVAGSSNSLTASAHAPWLLHVGSTGNLLWHRAVASDIWGDLGAVARTADGQIVVVGRVGEPGFPSNDLWAAKFDVATGGTLWQRAYEGDTGDFGSAVLPLTGAGLVLGGTWGWGFEGESIWLQRTDRAGGIAGCDLVRTTKYAMSSAPVTVRPGKAVRAPGGAVTFVLGGQTAASDAEVIERCR